MQDVITCHSVSGKCRRKEGDEPRRLDKQILFRITIPKAGDRCTFGRALGRVYFSFFFNCAKYMKGAENTALCIAARATKTEAPSGHPDLFPFSFFCEGPRICLLLLLFTRRLRLYHRRGSLCLCVLRPPPTTASVLRVYTVLVLGIAALDQRA